MAINVTQQAIKTLIYVIYVDGVDVSPMMAFSRLARLNFMISTAVVLVPALPISSRRKLTS